MNESELIKAQADLIAAQQKFIQMITLSGGDVSQLPCGMPEQKQNEPKAQKKEITLSEYVKIFLQNREVTTKQSTYHTYCWNLERYILPVLGDVELFRIDNRRLQQFADEKLKTLAKKSVRELVGLVKNILNDACINEVIEPKKFMIKYPKSENADYRTLSEDEFKLLETYLFLQEKPHCIGELIMLETGMRIGEMCGLKWEDVDIDSQIINIKRTIQRIYKVDNKTSEISIGSTKTSAGERAVPINKQVCEYLKRHAKVGSIYVASGNEYPTEPRTHRQFHKRLLTKVGIDYIKPHDLRHTFATRAIRKGVDPKTVSAILGHSNSNITLNIYTSVTEEMLRNGIEKMSV